ncbi:hypothetical protein [Selenomonas sp. AB3002]|uniref:hypothetical protein n=1 Tax=Selenomonas sp. AB3002 TaxID=1392502 RepID=UPI00163AA414
MPDAGRSYISRVNNSQGRIMEDMIMGAARKYEQEGRLVLHKESEPFRVVKNLDRARGGQRCNSSLGRTPISLAASGEAVLSP